MSEEPGNWRGEPPEDSVMVKSYEVGYGRLDFVSSEGGNSAPIVTVQPEGAPLLFFVAPDALTLGGRLEQAGVAALREFDPELANMPSPSELREKRDALIAEEHRRQRIILLIWMVTAIVTIVLAVVVHRGVWRGIQGVFLLPGLIWVTEVSATWFTERRLAREERHEPPKS